MVSRSVRTTIVVYVPFLPNVFVTTSMFWTQTSDPNVVPSAFMTPTTIQSRSPSWNVSPTSSRALPASAPRVPAAPSPSTHST